MSPSCLPGKEFLSLRKSFLLSKLLLSDCAVPMRWLRERTGWKCVCDLSLPLSTVEETEGSKHREQHEPYRGDSEEDAQSPGILFLWWWRVGRIDRSGYKLLLRQRWSMVMGRAAAEWGIRLGSRSALPRPVM